MANVDERLAKVGKLRGPSTTLTPEPDSVEIKNRASGAKRILSGGLASFGPGKGTQTGAGRSALQAYANRAGGTDSLSSSEQRLFDRDEAAHNAEKDRWSDKDAAPLPLYQPHQGIADKVFQDAVQKYLDQGMDYKSGWLAAKAANPIAFRAYSV